jgi:hypothetical protein
MSCLYQYKAKQLVFSAAILWTFAFMVSMPKTLFGQEVEARPRVKGKISGSRAAADVADAPGVWTSRTTRSMGSGSTPTLMN